jgi:hypothetical protein
MKLQAGDPQALARVAGTALSFHPGRGRAAMRGLASDAHREWAANFQQDESLVNPIT